MLSGRKTDIIVVRLRDGPLSRLRKQILPFVQVGVRVRRPDGRDDMKRNFFLLFPSDRMKAVAKSKKEDTLMKRLLAAIIAAVLLMGPAAAARAETPDIILVTVYEQAGWGDRISVGFVDRNGGLWTLEGGASELKWPAAPEEQIEYLIRSERKVQTGRLPSEDTSDLKGLIQCAEPRRPEPRGWACDAGTQRSYAARTRNGEAGIIMLGITGDDVWENTDANAQALFARLRGLFPNVPCYADMYMKTAGEPWGFIPVRLRDFLGIGWLDREDITMECRLTDCEEGLLDCPAAAGDTEKILNILRYSSVTGKANAAFVTGGTYVYIFRDGEGTYLGSFEVYGDLVVCSDGMYYIDTPVG